MTLLIHGLDSRWYRPLRWQGGDMRMLRLIYRTIGLRLPVKAATRTDLRSTTVTTSNVQSNHDQRPAGHPMEVINSEGTGKRYLLETGIQ
jgi:hypothetical protein